jgi:UDP-glucose:(heptosyl)LPS alpha-1,3-glucosyltransferase
MKVALNIEQVGARRGGAEKYAGSLARALAAAGHEVHVFARDVDRDELPAEVQVHLVRPARLPGLRMLCAYQFARASEQVLRREPFDLIVGFAKVWYQDAYLAVGGSHPATLACNSRRFRNPLVRAAWWLTKFMSPKQWIFRLIARRQFHTHYDPHIIACSRMVAEHFEHYHHTPSDRISVVYNGLDRSRELPDATGARETFRREVNLASDEVAVLFAAHNYSMKGLEPLIEAFARVASRFPRARLVVCGSRRDAAYRRQAERQGVADRVQFLGFVDDVRRAFAGCDVFAFPTFYDPCSLVVLEAMAAGLAVITTRQNGAGELLADGTDGFVIDSPWDLDALADRLARLLGDAELRRNMAASAAAKVPGMTIDVRLGELLAALNRTAAGGKASAVTRKVA